MFLSVLVLAATAASPPLPPTGKWVVSYNQEDCTLQRDFGDPKSPVVFGFKPAPTNISGDLVLLLPGPGKGTRRGKGSVTLLPGGDRFDAAWASGPLAGERHGVRFGAERAFWAALANAGAITFDVGEPQPITAALPALKGALAAVKACGDDLLRGWGVDPANAAPLDSIERVAGRFGPDAYPNEALSAGQQGRVGALTLFDRAGKPVSCRVVITSKAVSLDRRTCEIMMIKSRVVADPKGPEQRFLYLPVRWVLP